MKLHPSRFLRLVLFFGLLLASTRVLSAQVDLDAAFSQLKGNGAVPFARALFQNADNANRLVGRLEPLLDNAGDFNGYEVVSRRALTKRVERLIIAAYFDRYPIYLRIDLYESPRGVICLPALASKEAADVLPTDLIAIAGR